MYKRNAGTWLYSCHGLGEGVGVHEQKNKIFHVVQLGYECIKLSLSYTSISEIVEKNTDKFKHDVKNCYRC